jgi:transposase
MDGGSGGGFGDPVLHRHGKSIREIAREMGVARNTMRRYLRDEEAARYKLRPPRSTNRRGRPSSIHSRPTSPNAWARRRRNGYRRACC